MGEDNPNPAQQEEVCDCSHRTQDVWYGVRARLNVLNTLLCTNVCTNVVLTVVFWSCCPLHPAITHVIKVLEELRSFTRILMAIST